MKYGYARVSSRGQALYGTSLENQEQVLIKAGAEVVFKDAYTGVTVNRPEFEKLLSVLEPGDMLIVTKMDRLGRRAIDIVEITQKLLSQNISVNILNMGTINNTPIGKLTFQVMCSFAEFEHDMIVERLNEGRKIRREEREAMGLPVKKKNIYIEESKIQSVYKLVMSGRISQREACRRLEVGHNYFRRLLEDRGLYDKYIKQMSKIKDRRKLLKTKEQLGDDYIQIQSEIDNGNIEALELGDEFKAEEHELEIYTGKAGDIAEGYDLLSSANNKKKGCESEDIVFDNVIFDGLNFEDLKARDETANDLGIIEDIEELGKEEEK